MKVLYIGHSTVHPLSRGPRWFDNGYISLLKNIPEIKSVGVLCPKMPPSFGEDVPGSLSRMVDYAKGFNWYYQSDSDSYLKSAYPDYKKFFSFSGTYPLLFSLDMVYGNTKSKQLKDFIKEFDPDVVISCICLDKDYYEIKKLYHIVIDYYPAASLEFFDSQGLLNNVEEIDNISSVIKTMTQFVQAKSAKCDGFISGSPEDKYQYGNCCVVEPTVDSMNTNFSVHVDQCVRVMYSGTVGWHRFSRGFEILKSWTTEHADELRSRKIRFVIFGNIPNPEPSEFFEYQYRKIKGMDTEFCQFGIIPCEYTTGYPTKKLEYLAKGLIPIRPKGDFKEFVETIDGFKDKNPRTVAKAMIKNYLPQSVKVLREYLLR